MIEQGKNILNTLNEISSFINKNKNLKIHKDNKFNKNFSLVLSTGVDVVTLIERMGNEIKELQKVEHIIQLRNEKEDKTTISKKGQELRKLADFLTKNLEVDFKSLYIFSKIFLDKLVQLFVFIVDDNRGIKDSSISDFKKSLDKYNGENNLFLEFKKEFSFILKNIIDYLKFYRDKQIVHSKINQSFTVWFVNDMNGNIYFQHASNNGENIKSLSPKQIVDILEKFIMQLKNFIINKLDLQKYAKHKITNNS